MQTSDANHEPEKTMTATFNETKGTTITALTYFVLYGDHDSGSGSQGFMVREGIESAERTASLMDQCGYRLIEIKSAEDMLNG